MIPALDIRDAIALVTGLVTVTGAYFAVKGGQKESERLLKALHTRFDGLEKTVADIQIKHAVLEERVNNTLRQTGRFKLARLEAEKAGQSPMFIIEGE